MNRLDGKVALVTGAADGIGASAARLMAAEGATVVVSDINLQGASAVASALGGESIALELDVCEEQSWRNAMAAIIDAFGQLDILVNNAGGAGAGTIEEVSVEDFRASMRLNSDSVFIGSKLAIEVMKARGGNIINVSSIHGRRAAAHAASYSAGKGAVRLLTKSIALHCAQHGYRIRCNSIHPGYIMTTQMKQWVEDSENPQQQMAQLLASHPIGFLGEPDDIGRGIVFLASDDARFMTGSELVMDGGFELV
ncbi:MAG: glucose 1-dehydrogenase [Parahaliea sp.]